jgi:hypothetical protein
MPDFPAITHLENSEDVWNVIVPNGAQLSVDELGGKKLVVAIGQNQVRLNANQAYSLALLNLYGFQFKD